MAEEEQPPARVSSADPVEEEAEVVVVLVITAKFDAFATRMAVAAEVEGLNRIAMRRQVLGDVFVA